MKRSCVEECESLCLLSSLQVGEVASRTQQQAQFAPLGNDVVPMENRVPCSAGPTRSVCSTLRQSLSGRSSRIQREHSDESEEIIVMQLGRELCVCGGAQRGRREN